jgi:hypothetical protein
MMELEIMEMSDSAAFYPFFLMNLPFLVKNVTTRWSRLHSVVYSNGFASQKSLNAIFGQADVPVDIDGIRNRMSLEDALTKLKQSPSIYIKDWHASQHMGHAEGNLLYECPSCFQDDWMDLYWRCCRGNVDDYRFMYIGSKDTKTDLHHDVCLSYSWSVNLTGRKIWTLYHPDVCSSELDETGEGERSKVTEDEIDKNEEKTNKIIQVVQDPGVAIFIPSGWYHKVRNVVPSEVRKTMSHEDDYENEHDNEDDYIDATVSINQNWFNAFNVYDIWRYLLKELNMVRAELWHLSPKKEMEHGIGDKDEDDLRMVRGDWLKHCEVILRANSKFGVSDLMIIMASRLFSIMDIEKESKGALESKSSRLWIDIFCCNYCPENLTHLDQAVIANAQTAVIGTLHDIMSVGLQVNRQSHIDIQKDGVVESSEHTTSSSLTGCRIDTNVLFEDIYASCGFHLNNKIPVPLTLAVWSAMQVAHVVAEINCPELCSHLENVLDIPHGHKVQHILDSLYDDLILFVRESYL